MKLPKIEVKRNKDGGNPRLFLDGKRVRFNYSIEGCRSKYIDRAKRFIIKVESESIDEFENSHHDEKAFHKKLAKKHKPYFPKLLKASKKGRWSVHEYVRLEDSGIKKSHKRIVKQLIKAYSLNDICHDWCRNWALNSVTKLPCIFDGAYHNRG